VEITVRGVVVDNASGDAAVIRPALEAEGWHYVYSVRDELAHIPAQLTQRTNQLNFTTFRRTESEMSSAASEASSLVLRVNVRDRFGEYGLVGLAVAKAEGCRLHAMLRRLCRGALFPKGFVGCRRHAVARPIGRQQ
jgi:hypothetical protein